MRFESLPEKETVGYFSAAFRTRGSLQSMTSEPVHPWDSTHRQGEEAASPRIGQLYKLGYAHQKTMDRDKSCIK